MTIAHTTKTHLQAFDDYQSSHQNEREHNHNNDDDGNHREVQPGGRGFRRDRRGGRCERGILQLNGGRRESNRCLKVCPNTDYGIKHKKN